MITDNVNKLIGKGEEIDLCYRGFRNAFDVINHRNLNKSGVPASASKNRCMADFFSSGKITDSETGVLASP